MRMLCAACFGFMESELLIDDSDELPDPELLDDEDSDLDE